MALIPVALSLLVAPLLVAGAEPFVVGLGKADMTGPIVEVNQMGYANPQQLAAGIHTRLFARAFIVGDPVIPESRICFVSMDAGMPSQAQKIALVKKLRAKFGNKYTDRNVLISGTHTHSGPSGFFQYMLLDLAGSLFVNQTFTAFVDGVFDAIVAADTNLQPGSIAVAQGQVDGANINRSPSSYLYNPASERSRYPSDTDHGLVQLSFRYASGAQAGLFNWFAAHPTSMNFTNHLISADHKGTASQYLEQAADAGALTGQESFVAAFASTNLGDVSPNTAGPFCHGGPDEGRPCALNTSTCRMEDGSSAPTYCWSLGPGRDMFESTKMIARKQSDLASQLLADVSSQTALSGPVGFSHSYVNMSDYALPGGLKTCPPSLGYGFAGGTTDGPGDAPFYQACPANSNCPSSMVGIELLKDILQDVLCSIRPTKANDDCHFPKPVLLPTGFMDVPFKWHPDIVDVQLFRIGSFVIAGVPGEFTTMSGRRLREALQATLASVGIQHPQVVIAGLSNLYTHYIATPEEYTAQRYEAASTIYGPQTLPAYIDAFQKLVPYLINGTAAPPGPNPPDFVDKQIEGLAPPGVDMVLPGHHLGQVIKQPQKSYFFRSGAQETVVNCTFYGSNPRQALRRGGTFLEVQQLLANGSWATIANDNAIATRLYWKKVEILREETAPVDAPMDEVGLEIPKHMRSAFDIAQRVTGRRVSPTLLAGCVAREALPNGRRCTYNEASVPVTSSESVAEDGHVRDVGPLYHSEITISWRPAEHSSSAAKLETGMYRLVYYGDAMHASKQVTSFNGTSDAFRLVVEV